MTIKRVAMTEDATFGVIIDESIPFALTLEKPWKDNQHDISSIPSGEYLVRKTIRIKFGLTFEVLQVPNRDGILIHKGNFSQDTHGCILLGESFEDTLSPDGKKIVTGVMSTGKAYSELITRLNQADNFKLVIKDL